MSKKKDINFPQAAIHSKELNELPTTARWLYAVIAREAEDKEATFSFKYERMIEITGFAKTTISRGLIDLAAAGFIHFERISSGHANEYTIIDWQTNNIKTSTNKSYSDEELAIILWTLEGCPTGTVDEILEYNADDIVGACEVAIGFTPE